MRIASHIILSLFLLACSSHTATTNTTAEQSPVLSDSEWILQTMDGTFVTGAKKPISLKIIAAEKRVTGYAGCNQFFSSYTAEGKSIKFTAPGRTKMACKDSMDTEERFLAALTHTNAFRLEKGRLILLEGETVLLEFTQ